MKLVKSGLFQKLMIITLVLYLTISFSIRSEVVIGRGAILDKQVFNYHSLTVDNRVYWINSDKKFKVDFNDNAYVYSYSLFWPKWRIITNIKPLDH